MLKWLWRCVSDEGAVWSKILRFRYGNLYDDLLYGVNRLGPKRCSIWWRDLRLLVDLSGSWVRESVRLTVGNGSRARFWLDVWVGSKPLQERFPRLFGLAQMKEGCVTSMGCWEGEEWRWRWVWRRKLFAWEDLLVKELEGVVSACNLSKENPDTWIWSSPALASFSVRGIYTYLQHRSLEDSNLNLQVPSLLKTIWDVPIPSKVKICLWRLCFDKLPTRESLGRRGVLSGEDMWCPFGCKQVESVGHIIFSCCVAREVWKGIAAWVGSGLVGANAPLENFRGFTRQLRGIWPTQACGFIWGAVVWMILANRNYFVFQGIHREAQVLIAQVKRISWLWTSKLKGGDSPVAWEDWLRNPRAGLLARWGRSVGGQ